MPSMKHSSNRNILFAATLAISFMSTLPALADDTSAQSDAAPAASPDVHRSIDEAINRQRNLRAWSVVGIVAGTATILGGAVASASDNSSIGCIGSSPCPTHHNNTGYYIAGGVGLPLLVGSIYLFSHAQHNINQLRASPVAIGYSPETHKPTLQISFGF